MSQQHWNIHYLPPPSSSPEADLSCDVCNGDGRQAAPHSETGHDAVECLPCLGTGLNQLGLIVTGLLHPPNDGSGPTILKRNPEMQRKT
jgi:hypothetical protein